MNIIRQIPRKLPEDEYEGNCWDAIGLDEGGRIYFSDEIYPSEQSAQTAIEEGKAAFLDYLHLGPALDEARRLFGL